MKIEKTKYFWMYIVLGALVILSSVILSPVWESAGDWAIFKTWGQDILNIIIAGCLIAYLVFFLCKKIKKSANKINLALVLIEFVIICLLIIGLLLSQFKILNVGGACQTLGFVLWLRGSVEVFRAYYFKNAENDKYPIYFVAIAIALVTFGTCCAVKPFISDEGILWIVVLILLLCGIYLLIYGIISKPIKAKKQRIVKQSNKTKSKETKNAK